MPILTCPTPEVTDPLFGSGNYTLSFLKFPEITFFIQETELPSLMLGVANFSTSVHDIPIPGESVDFSTLSCSFVVDAKMKNYRAIHEWLIGMGYPEDHKMYRELLASDKNISSPTEIAKGYSDGVLTIMGNDSNPLCQARFVDCFPMSISGLRFSSSANNTVPLTAQVEFKYSYYTLAFNA